MEKGQILLVTILEKIKIKPSLIKSIHNYTVNLLKKFYCKPEITMEEWEQIERKYSPHSSHHAQVYYRNRS